jgi:hypothetical protein
MGPTHPPIHLVLRASSQGVKWSGRKNDHSPLASNRGQNSWGYTPLPRMSSCHRGSFAFLLPFTHCVICWHLSPFWARHFLCQFCTACNVKDCTIYIHKPLVKLVLLLLKVIQSWCLVQNYKLSAWVKMDVKVNIYPYYMHGDWKSVQQFDRIPKLFNMTARSWSVTNNGDPQHQGGALKIRSNRNWIRYLEQSMLFDISPVILYTSLSWTITSCLFAATIVTGS